jgi:mRNA deadenylase 3'-5' endonuclease subunit Ccr4
MNILNWNVRGLGKSKRRRLVKDMLLFYNIDIVSLQETKKEEFKNKTLKNLSSHITKWLVLPSQGRSGGILLGINEGIIDLLDYWIHSFSISILIKNKNSGFIWLYTTVYAPISMGLRNQF